MCGFFCSVTRSGVVGVFFTTVLFPLELGGETQLTVSFLIGGDFFNFSLSMDDDVIFGLFAQICLVEM